MSTKDAACPKLMWLPDGTEVCAWEVADEVRFLGLGARYTVEPTPAPAEVAAAPTAEIPTIFEPAPVEAVAPEVPTIPEV